MLDNITMDTKLASLILTNDDGILRAKNFQIFAPEKRPVETKTYENKVNNWDDFTWFQKVEFLGTKACIKPNRRLQTLVRSIFCFDIHAERWVLWKYVFRKGSFEVHLSRKEVHSHILDPIEWY